MADIIEVNTPDESLVTGGIAVPAFNDREDVDNLYERARVTQDSSRMSGTI